MNIDELNGSNLTGNGQPVQIYTVYGALTVPPSTVINEYSAMTVPAFWRAVSFLTSTLAGLPKDILRKRGDSRENVSHPLVRLLSVKPNDYSTPFVCFETWTHHAAVWGNGYLWIERDNLARPSRLHPINPELVTPFIHKGRKWFYVETKEPFVLANEDVLHIHGLGFDGIQGYPLVEMMKQALESGKNAETYTSDYFKKRTIVSGFLETPGSLTQPQIDTIQNSLAKYKGVGGSDSHGVPVLPFGLSFKNSTIPNETSQLIETRKFSIIDVCRMLGVPPQTVYELGDNKYATAEQTALDLIKYSLTSWVLRAEQELSQKLLSEREQEQGVFIRLNIDGLLRGDQASRTNNVVALVNNGLATPNWGAAKLDLPPLGSEGDRLRIPVSQAMPIAEAQGGAGGGETAPPDSEPADFARVLEPLIEDAAERVESKTRKAFERREGKPATEISAWVDAFAAEQAATAAEQFAPIARAAQALGKSFEAEEIGRRYAAEVRRFAATKDKGNLSDIAKGVIYGTV